MALPATDTFTTATDQALTAYSASWSNVNGVFYVYAAGDNVSPNSAVESAARWNADTFANDQYAQAVVSSVTSEWVGVSVRCASGAANFYGFYTGTSGDASYLFKVIGGTWTQLGSNGASVAAGNTIRLEASGTSLTAYVGGTPSGIGTQTDGSISSGYAGLSGYGSLSSGHVVDNWEGGDIGGSSHVDLPAIDYSQHPKLRALARYA